MSNYTVNKAEQQTATIDISADDDLSNAIDITGRRIAGIITPSALTSTAITFSVSQDGTTYETLYKSDGNAKSITVAASRFTNVLSDELHGFNFFKLIMGTSEIADRELIIVTVPA